MKGLGEILSAVRTLEEPSALSTLVRTRGSSYRLPGARMLFRPGGLQTGSISAGCLEADVKERVAEVLASHSPALVAFDLTSDFDLLWGTRMGCAGKADVLLERVEPGQPPPWVEACALLLEERRTGTLATIFAVRGDGPIQAGTRCLVAEGEALIPVPAALAAHLGEAMARGSGNVTLQAGGQELDLLLEPLAPPPALWVFGAGEHARPIFRLAKELGWFLGLVDHRPAMATAARFPEADRILVGHPPEVFEGLFLDGRSAALVVSHVYDLDKAYLDHLLDAPLAYLGLQGNRKRSERILREISEERGPLTAAMQSLLHCPAGLDLGAETPETIALAMVSEVQATLAGRPGSSLRDRQGPIH